MWLVRRECHNVEVELALPISELETFGFSQFCRRKAYLFHSLVIGEVSRKFERSNSYQYKPPPPFRFLLFQWMLHQNYPFKLNAPCARACGVDEFRV